MIEIFLNILILIIFPFIFIGIINKTKAFWAGRKGQRLFQFYFDFIKLLKKVEVISLSTSFIFRIAPAIILASTIISGIFVPMIGSKNIFSFQGDFIVFAYIFAVGRFFFIISAMDTGSSFEGMGASREATFSSLVEPAFFIILASIGSINNNFSFSNILQSINYGNWIFILIIVICIIVFFIMLLTECSRIPVDDPNTHLELTMIHEVMILDNSGPDLALIHFASGMKMVIISSLIINLIVPASLGLLYSSILFIILLSIIPIIIGCIESFIARLRMVHIPQFIILMLSIALIVLSIIQFTFNKVIK